MAKVTTYNALVMMPEVYFRKFYLERNTKPKISILECYTTDGIHITRHKHAIFDNKYVLSYFDDLHGWAPYDVEYIEAGYSSDIGRVKRFSKYIKNQYDCFSMEILEKHYNYFRKNELEYIIEEDEKNNIMRRFNGEKEINTEKEIRYTWEGVRYHKYMHKTFFISTIERYNKKLEQLNRRAKIIKILSLGLIDKIYVTNFPEYNTILKNF